MGEGELSIEHFRSTIKSETAKLTGFCTIWRQNLKNNENLSEENQGDINVAVGQAELLMKQRFGQFSNLVDQSENKTGEKEITNQDLDGFWFMIYPQVEDVCRKFGLLETLKKNNWVKPEVTAPPKKVPVIKIQKPVASTTKPKPLVSGKSGSASSSIRAHILAAKMRMKEQQEKAQLVKPQIPQDNVEKVLAKKIDKENKSPSSETPSVLESSKTTIITTPCSDNNKNTPSVKNSPTNGSKIPIRKASPANKENCASLAKTKVTGKKVQITTPKSTPKSTPKGQLSPPASRKSTSPESNTFDAGFFRVQTPVKKVLGKKNAAPLITKNDKNETNTKSKVSTGPKMQKMLSSSMLKERFHNVPLEHKDYSSCMRITRSMKNTMGVRKLDI